MAIARRNYGDKFFYQLYFQQPGLAEGELDGNPREFLSRIYTSPATPRDPPQVVDPRASAGGWTVRIGKPKASVPWMKEPDLDYYVGEFEGSGFFGPISRYRNHERDFEWLQQFKGRTLDQPSLLIGGDKDPAFNGFGRIADPGAMMRNFATRLQGVHVLPGCGHWTQQERPAEVNAILIPWLKGL